MRRTATALLLVGILLGGLGSRGGAEAQSRRAAAPTAPPDWAYDAVWYQIFPERFRNGDTRNDPTKETLAGSWPHDPVGEWRVSPWTSDWYALQPWERKNGRDFWYNAQLRRYGGDLQGVLEKLDYLKSLGVTAIYLNPVFEAPSLHKYDATMYHHVDDNFGPDPAGDRALWATEDPADPKTWRWSAADRLLLEIVAEAHRRDMKVVLDGVFNHTGITFWAFLDVKKNGERSRYRDWYTITRFDDPATPADEMEYKAWLGIAELPELRDEGDTLAAGPREHVRAVVRRWMDPNGDGNPSDGIDGWRLDVAEPVGHGFWREFRTWVREVNPNAYITGEVWWEDWKSNKMFNAAPWLAGDQFDAVMNYRFTEAVKGFLVDRKNAISATELDRRLATLRSDYRPETAYVLMNLMDSHDTDRLASQIVNPDRLYDHRITPKEDPAYETRAPRGAELARLRLTLAFQFAYVGAPMLYYGGETGMWGGDDPDERKPMVWPDLKYEAERADPLGRPRTPDPVRYDRSLADYVRTLARLRASRVELRRGTFETVVADDARRVFAFARTMGDARTIAIFNASEQPQVVTFESKVALRDLVTGQRFPTRKWMVSVRVPALSAVYASGT